MNTRLLSRALLTLALGFLAGALAARATHPPPAPELSASR